MSSCPLTVVVFVSVLALISFLPVSHSQSQPDPGASSDKDWRCAIFLLPDQTSSDQSNSPTKVWSFPTRFKTPCANPNPGAYNRTCYEIMRRSFRQWSYDASSQTDPKSGNKIGDDFCALIGKNEVDGREVGFFFNYCARNEWLDTGLRRPDKVCCVNGKYLPCPTSQ